MVLRSPGLKLPSAHCQSETVTHGGRAGKGLKEHFCDHMTLEYAPDSV